nr:transposase [Actinomadura hibisca]
MGICDNDSIHHARAVRDFVVGQPGLHLWFGAHYSPDGNLAERLWASRKAFVPTPHHLIGSAQPIHAFFRARPPDQHRALEQPLVSPCYMQNSWNA